MVRIISEFLNKTMVNIEVIDKKQIIFTCSNGEQYAMEHEPISWEEVWLEDIDGNLDNLLNTPILLAEEVYERGTNDGGTYTWTFYKFASAKGYVTLRWYGESNGYYSEDVYIYKMD